MFYREMEFHQDKDSENQHEDNPQINQETGSSPFLFVAQLFVVIIFLLANPEILSNQANLTDIAYNGLLLSTATIVSGIAGLGLIVVFIRVRKNIGIREYLALHPIGWKTILSIMGITVLLLILSEVAGIFLGQGSDSGTNFIVDAYNTAVFPALLWIAIVIFAPVFEESFFRGFLFIGFSRSRIGAVGAIILTAFLWSILHIQYNIFGMMVIFILGLILGYVRLKTNSLWSSITLHASWNFLTMVGTVLYAMGIIH